MIGYAETKAKIERGRLLPWASSTSYKIAGYDMLPLTLSSLVDLELNNNYMLTQKYHSKIAGDVVAYIWRHTKHYRENGGDWRTALEKQRLINKVAKKYDLNALLEQCEAHYQDALSESPVCISLEKNTVRNYKMPASPSIAYIVDEVCAEYSISINECMKAPVKKLFQLMRCIRLRKHSEGRGAKVTFKEPAELKEAIKAELNKLTK
jgi:hypothetical protein